MSDLDKLMKKLQKEEPEDNEKVAEAPEIALKSEKIPEIPAKFDDDDDEEEDDEEEELREEEKPKVKPKVCETPPQTVDPVEHAVDPVEHEVILLQNPAIYRREMLIVQKEQNKILTAIAEILLNGNKGK